MSKAINDLIGQGPLARREGRTQEALAAYERAVEASRLTASQPLLAEALNGLARIERDLNDLDLSLVHYREAEVIRRQIGQPVEHAHALRRMADVLRHQQESTQAEQAYLEAISIYRAHEEECALDLANALRGLALLAASRDVATAVNNWREAGVLYERLGVEAGVQESARQVRILSAR